MIKQLNSIRLSVMKIWFIGQLNKCFCISVGVFCIPVRQQSKENLKMYVVSLQLSSSTGFRFSQIDSNENRTEMHLEALRVLEKITT